MLLLLSLAGFATVEAVSYTKHQVWTLDSPDPALWQEIIDMPHDEVSIWKGTDVSIGAEHLGWFGDLLAKWNVSHTVKIQDVQELIDVERAHTAARQLRQGPNYQIRAGNKTSTDPFFSDYHDFDDMMSWLDSLASQYPSIMNIYQYGHSYEQNPLRVARITNGQFGVKPVIYWEGGIHAREWIAHTTMCYMISKLVTGYNVDPTVNTILDQFEFHIVPVVNPDGYKYTWEKDRMWRKTRSPNAGSICIGTDPNRNWDDHWCEAGASRLACSDSYCGKSAFSEVEVLAVSQYIASVNASQPVVEVIDYHSYSQLFMAPWGWSSNTPPDAAIQKSLGQGATDEINSVNNKNYKFGQIATIIYPASGSSADWVYDKLGVKFSYGVELRDEGQYGFVLPANQIIPQGEEVWASLTFTAEWMKDHKFA
jgi:murein tripeptide amidase MpaA